MVSSKKKTVLTNLGRLLHKKGEKNYNDPVYYFFDEEGRRERRY